MSTITSTVTQPPSQLISSIASLSSSQSLPPHISRIYKQASHLFLTRQTQVALETLLPLIAPGNSPSDHPTQSPVPPVASASRGIRIKVWNLYISIINEIVEVGADAGKKEFGSARWKELVAKARDGSIWDDVVNQGYKGIEGAVDADVVANLAILLLAHQKTQSQNQERLEAYLATATQPSIQSNIHSEGQLLPDLTNAVEANTLRELAAYLRILEIYTLHVLPANGQWKYAEEFIEMNDLLDEERKEVFLQTLQSLRDEEKHDAAREQELQKQRAQQLEDARRREVEEETARQAQAARAEEQERQSREARASAQSNKPAEKPLTKSSPKGGGVPKSSNASASSSTSKGVTNTNKARPARPPKAPPASFYKRASSTLAALPNLIISMSRSFRSNPIALFQTLLFTIALVTALARRDVRDRIMRAKDTALAKIKATANMGVKVSYV